VHGGRHPRAPDQRLELDHLRDLVAHVGGVGHAVELGDPVRRADEDVQLADVRAQITLPIDAGEDIGHVAGVLPFATHEHPLPRDEHVLEDREGLEELVPAGHRRGLGVADVVRRAGDELHAGGVDRDGEGDGVVRVLLPHRPRGGDDQLLGGDAAGRVHLAAPDDDPVGTPLDDAEIRLLVWLVGRPQATVALGIGDGR
jgi:hypothetical protein